MLHCTRSPNGEVSESIVVAVDASAPPVALELDRVLAGMEIERMLSSEAGWEATVRHREADRTFRIWRSNGDVGVNLSDAVFTLSYLFQAGPTPYCLDAADANDDGRIDISDPVKTLGSLFLGEGSLPPPHSARGPDPTDDEMRC